MNEALSKRRSLNDLEYNFITFKVSIIIEIAISQPLRARFHQLRTRNGYFKPSRLFLSLSVRLVSS